ncbi:MAG: DNA polymerase III subunit alpha [Lentisphaerae bacterium]|nr:DNA polymerase III subunit alpha [Lentisphaerota bacterium]
MPADFVHLHVHSHYSLLDGACTVKQLLEMTKEYDMIGCAITDHGYLGGAVDMYDTFKAGGKKPIIGCEVYVSPTTRFDRNPSTPHIRGHHLVLLAENIQGYHSMCKLLSEAWLNGMYYKPRVDHDLLREHHEGLIALSACIAGEIPSAILDNNMEKAQKLLNEHLDIFGKDNFFLEIQDHGMEEERISNRGIIELARKNNIPLVATNDIHYLKKEHAEAHEIMLCIQTQSKLSDENRFRFPAPEFYFKSPEEMKALFREVPESVTNTVGIAERCDLDFVYAPKANHYPVFTIPDGSYEKDYLRNFCLDNMMYRYGFDPRELDTLTPEQQEVMDRMDYELGIIDKTKYCSYFLVVSDFIKYAKDHGIPVGPGRGSGAGSVVAYLAKITDIDPLRYGLLFERFLNPERVSPPDFDIDFCEQRRGEVIEYVRKKYGEDSVAQICTYGTLKAKAVVKDVARVLGHDFAAGDRITKQIPADPKMTLAKAKKESSELEKMITGEPYVAEIFKHAEVLEGINRQLGIHAAGVIICNQRLDNLVPLARGAKGEVITEFPAVQCEHLGLLKMDFLGLRTLTTIQRAVDMIEKNRGIKLDMAKIPLDDPASFQLLNRGDTISVFQLESQGMRNLCRQFGVENIKHIIALIAIYRPGPMQFIDTFIARKRGTEEIIYDHPKMEEYLSETYGIMLYQEQIMQVVQVLAGFSLGGADILRRAIGKKKADVLAEQKSKFVEGCARCNNISEEVANSIWAKIETFAGYGFNKSHSAAYAFVAYRTAFLKANYPVEFMAAVLTSEIDNAEKIAFLINTCHDMRIPVLPPDINSSDISFSVDKESIRFGLGAIKGVGENAAGKIIESREKEGRFKDFNDFCERCGSAMNSRMIDNLARAGAFDSLNIRRSQILAIAEDALKNAAAKARDRAAGQGSLFDLMDDSSQQEFNGVAIPDIPEFDVEDILKHEKELLGFYVTAHPLSPCQAAVEALSTVKLSQLEEVKDYSTERIAGMLNSVTKKFSKRDNKPYLILNLEDFESATDVMVYSDAYEKMLAEGLELTAGMNVAITATISRRDENEAPRVVADKVELLDSAVRSTAQELLIDLYEEEVTDETLSQLKKLLDAHAGNVKTAFCIVIGNGDRYVFIERKNAGVDISVDLIKAVTALLGPRHCKLKVSPPEPSQRRRWNRDFAQRNNGE